MKTLILGSTGFLGSNFSQGILENVTKHVSEKTNEAGNDTVVRKLSTPEDIEFLEIEKYERVINCIAIANIEDCKADPKKALWINSELPGLVASKCLKYGTRFVHFSTDAVFNGSISFATEEDTPNPKSIYGTSKLLGDTLVLNANPDALILRVNFFGSNPRGSSLFDYFYNAFKSGQNTFGYSDLYFTPTYVRDLVRMTLEIDSKGVCGLVHAVGSERISKYEFGSQIRENLGLDNSFITKIPANGLLRMQARSLDLSLSNRKLISYGIQPQSYLDGLNQLISDLRGIL
jgi:dTDP-4-dehydrorhamnose reductase